MQWSYSYGGGYTIDYSPAEFSFYKENNFDRIRAPKFSLRGEPGTPELPAAYLNYIIPPNAKADSLIVSQFQFVQLPGEYYIYPAQPVRFIGETLPWISPDTFIYNSDNIFPGKFIEIVGEGVMDGARIVTVEVKLLQYRPKTKRLYLVRPIDFEFVFSQRPIPELRAKVRGKYEQVAYDAALRNVVVNYNEISIYYQKPTIVEENQIGGAAPYPVGPAIIIAPLQFHSAFQPYADWMTDQGIKTYLITPQTIYQYFPGVDNAEKVRNYIKYCYENAGGTYFILGGDDYFLPVRYAYPRDWNPGEYIDISDSIPCDMYFSDLSGNWDADGDGVWGELTHDQADRYPEVFVGRIPAYNTNEVVNWVDKALNYEISPGFEPNNLITALWIYNWEVGKGFAYQHMPSHISHIDCEDQWANYTLSELNVGYGLVTTDCHGDIGCFASRWLTNEHAFIRNYYPSSGQWNAGLNLLTNQNKNYICYSIACWNGAYDSCAHTDPYYPHGSDTCIADAFVDAYSFKGACAYLGNTRPGIINYGGWSGPSFLLQANFYENIFELNHIPNNDNALSRLGVAEALSKNLWDINWFDWQCRHVCYAHNLFGSPYIEGWTNIPHNLNVSHPIQTPVGQQTQFLVRVRDATTNNPVQWAKVCLNKPNDIYQAGYTNANGQITFVITPRTEGMIKVTVTRAHNLSTGYVQYLPHNLNL